MNGKKAKSRRKIRDYDVKQLEAAVNHNYLAAAAATEAFRWIMWQNFWANVAMAALLTYCAANMHEDRMDELSTAVLFVLPEGQQGVQL